MKKDPDRFWKWLDFMYEQSLRPGPFRHRDPDFRRFQAWIVALVIALLAIILSCKYLSELWWK